MNASIALILGAGPPTRGTTPAALIGAGHKKRVLDWLLVAYHDITQTHLFIGGYQLDDIVRTYPQLNYAINPNWQSNSTVGSLLVAKLSPNKTYFVSYSDILYRQNIVKQVQNSNTDITLAIDSCWQQRYLQRSKLDLQQAETVYLKNNQLIKFSLNHTHENHTQQAEFIGLVKFSSHAVKHILDLEDKVGLEIETWNLPKLINELINTKLSTAVIDVQGDWAELNAAQDLAQFILGTKAQTLARLKPMVTTCVIGDQVTLDVDSWQANSRPWLSKIQQAFSNKKLAIRSSASNEDGFYASNAGGYTSILNIDSAVPQAITQAVEQVITSYGNINENQQVLVQAMVEDIAISGVAFTRTLSYGAPYYVINYDAISQTSDTVTSGNSNQLQTLIIYRDNPTNDKSEDQIIQKLVSSLQELEALVGYDLLDVEFIISSSGIVHILQIRPITVDHSHWRGTDENLAQNLVAAKQLYLTNKQASPFLFGNKNIYGIMPDWNPAEIIGTKPRALAFSLYRTLVTDEVWAKQRQEFGYRSVSPQALMLAFAGHPYIDIRASFNSFIPKNIADKLAEKLVNHYLDRLCEQPHYHDKIEFDIAFTCKTFDFDQQADKRLRTANFSDNEIQSLSQALTQITNHAFERLGDHHDMHQINKLAKRCQQITLVNLPPLNKALLLLKDCQTYGSLPFAHLARSAFVAMSLINSAVTLKAISAQTKHKFLNSIHTVAKDYRNDIAKLQNKQLTLTEFIDKYGHLRPGTYDITVPAYKDDVERYIQPLLQDHHTTQTIDEPIFHWDEQDKKNITELLTKAQLNNDFSQFETFIRTAIQWREQAKFIFTRNLSTALNYISDFATQHNLSRDDISHLSVEDLQRVQNGFTDGNLVNWLTQRITQTKQTYEINLAIELPPLITNENDFEHFHYPNNEPNFVSHHTIRAPVCHITTDKLNTDALKGNIVMIPQADPGFDWLFGHQIAGLITAYGGANSHMAIRSAEFGLPAAIGVGKLLYEKLKSSKTIHLDCRSRRIEAIA